MTACRRWLIGLIALMLSGPSLAYEIQTVAAGLSYPWSIAFLPNGSMLVTEKTGSLRLIQNNQLVSQPIRGVPEVFWDAQGGLFDVVLHPDFANNHQVYLSYAHGGPSQNALRVGRASLSEGALNDFEVVFTVEPFKDTAVHYGGRIAFLPDKTLIITSGDGFEYREYAQHLDGLLGKTIRINDDGTVPPNNPFLSDPGVRDEIWSFGHRNPQGLAVDQESGRVYLHEHGPLGGDELNLIEPGENYGWPIATFGLNYSGAYVSPYTTYPGTRQPLLHWTPSIAPADMSFYQGAAFPQWRGDLFVAALVEKSVRRLDFVDGEVAGQEILFQELDERIRAVRAGPDGFLYLLTDSVSGRVIRIRPE